MSDLHEDPLVKAEAHGWAIVYPQPEEVFLDLDDDASVRVYEASLPVLNRLRDASELPPFVVEARRTVSPGGKTHVYLRFPEELTDLERIAWQAVLGSDRTRELMGLMRLATFSKRPATCFFERAVSHEEVHQGHADAARRQLGASASGGGAHRSESGGHVWRNPLIHKRRTSSTS